MEVESHVADLDGTVPGPEADVCRLVSDPEVCQTLTGKAAAMRRR